MKFYDGGLTILIIVVVVSAIAAAASYKILGPDSVITKEAESVVETEAESLILKETGIDIPLTQVKIAPATPTPAPTTK